MPDYREMLEWPRLLESLAERCSSEAGRARVPTLEEPAIGEIVPRLNRTGQFMEFLARGNRVPFAGLIDVTPFLERARREGVLQLEELVRIRSFLRSVETMRHFMKELEEEFHHIREAGEGLSDRGHPAEKLFSAITDDGQISRSEYPGLAHLEERIAESRKERDRLTNRFIHDPKHDHLLQDKVTSSRAGRQVVLLKASMKGRAEGTIHDISSSGQTLYFEPARLMSANNQVIALEQELNHEIYLILKELSGRVSQSAEEMASDLEIMIDLDLLTSAARLGNDLGGSIPEITEEPVIDCKNIRHPLLVLMIDDVVGNDFRAGEKDRCVLISGANTGGKTVLLKALGLAALMARHALPVVAGPDSRIGLFDHIMADIGDDQDLQASLSTFSGQVVALRNILNEATKRSLVLVDEIMDGTSPEQGAALAWAVLEELADRECLTVATSHYPVLAEKATRDDRFTNASVSFDLETLRPTYHLHPGIPGTSHALEIASIYGMPVNVIERALGNLDDYRRSLEGLAADMQLKQRELAEARAELERQKELHKHKEEELNRKESALKQERKRLSEEKGLEAMEDLLALRDTLKDKLKETGEMDRKEAAGVMEEVSVSVKRLEERISGMRRERLEEAYTPLLREQALPGTRVFLPDLEKEALIEDVDPRKEEVLVRIGERIHSRYPFNRLLFVALPGGSDNRAGWKRPPEPNPSQDREEVTIQTRENSIDLRGMRVDEALQQLDNELDRKLRANIGTVIIIHGHGTGALRDAVRNHLNVYRVDEEHRPGREGEGGDGVTILRFR